MREMSIGKTSPHLHFCVEICRKKKDSKLDRSDKKPKDLKRAIGKLDKEDWNIKNIEEKMEKSKKTEGE